MVLFLLMVTFRQDMFLTNKLLFVIKKINTGKQSAYECLHQYAHQLILIQF